MPGESDHLRVVYVAGSTINCHFHDMTWHCDIVLLVLVMNGTIVYKTNEKVAWP